MKHFRMNLYRLWRSKMFWVLLFASLLLSVIVTVTPYIAYKETKDYVENSVGLAIGGMADQYVKFHLYELIFNVFTVTLISFSTVFFGIQFFREEASSGFLKNTAGYMRNPFATALSNLLISALFALISMLLVLLVNTGLLYLFYGEKLVFDNREGLVRYLLVFFFETVAYTWFLTALSDLTGKHVLFLVLGLVHLLFHRILYSLISVIILVKTEADVVLSRYTLLGGMSYLNLTSETEEVWLLLNISLLALALSYALDVFALKKREIK